MEMFKCHIHGEYKPMCAKKSPVQPKTKVVYEKTYKLKTVVQIKLKTKSICNLTVLGSARRSFYYHQIKYLQHLSSNSLLIP